jgi:peroxiredoxin (alkyl hydroperoxide reductase subunit C)
MGVEDVFPLTDQDFPGTWKVYVFWPGEFDTLSRDEIARFGRCGNRLVEQHAQVLGVTVESERVQSTGRERPRVFHPNPPNSGVSGTALRDFPFPMLTDSHRSLARQLGILDERDGYPQRATFIVDPQGTIRFVYVTDKDVERDPEEIIRVLAGLEAAA